jgi:hypothetical protein
MNTNTLTAFVNLPTLSLASGSETVLPAPSPSPLFPLGSAAVLSFENGTTVQDSRPFKIRLFGRFTSVVLPQTFTIKLYFVPPGISPVQATPGNLTALFSSPPINQAFGGPASGNFALTAELLWDSNSQKLAGILTGFYNSTNSVIQVGPTASIQIPNVANLTDLKFAASFQLLNVPGNSVTVSEFSLEQE